MPKPMQHYNADFLVDKKLAQLRKDDRVLLRSTKGHEILRKVTEVKRVIGGDARLYDVVLGTPKRVIEMTGFDCDTPVKVYEPPVPNPWNFA